MSKQEQARELLGRLRGAGAHGADLAHEMAELGDEAVPVLMEGWTSDDANTRAWSIYAVFCAGMITQKELFPAFISGLTRALWDPNGNVRDQAANALGWLGPWTDKRRLRRAVETLMARLLDDYVPARRSAAYALMMVAPEIAREALVRALDDEDSYTGALAGHALARLGDERALPRLLELATHPDGFTRDAAVAGLGALGNPAALPCLLDRLCHDRLRHVRDEAARAVVAVAAPAVLPELLAAATDPEPQTRTVIAEALGKAGCMDALETLARLCADPAAEVRSAAAEALGRIGDARSLPTLQALRASTSDENDPEGFVREAAGRAIRRIQRRERPQQ